MNNTTRLALITFTTAIAYSPALADLTAAETRLLAVELGATPDALTAAGFSLSTTQQALTRLAEQEQTAAALRQQRAQVATLQTTLMVLNASARAAPDEVELQRIESEISTARADIATAVALAETARSQLVTTLVGSSVNLAHAEQVFSPCLLPAAYRAAELTDAQMSELRSALAAERHAQVRGQSPSTPVQQTLAGFRSIPAVSIALGSQAAHLDAVQQLFAITE
jgi:hypothetical protein